MPEFVVIGAAKSGTTALYAYLRQHPQVFMPAVQEPSWFSFSGQELAFTGPQGIEPSVNRSAVTARDDYEGLFADANPSQRRGDVSPVYLYWPGTAERLSDEVGHARIVAVLRHPVDRAYSAFMHARREDREPISEFREALAAEPGRIAENCGFMWRYRDLGRYAPQLGRWLRVFPREQMLVATYDEFAADPVAFCQRVQQFIGVDPDFTPETSIRHNESGLPRSRSLHRLVNSQGRAVQAIRRIAPAGLVETVKGLRGVVNRRILERVPLDPEVRDGLVADWAEDIQAIGEVIDLPVDHWLDPE